MNDTYSVSDLLSMYHHLKRARIFTLKMHECVERGLIRSSFHTPYGQEAVGVGMVSALRDTDWFTPTHRLQTAAIMRMDLSEFIGELFGLTTGKECGVDFDFHMSDYSEGGGHMTFSIGTLGGAVPMQTGFAWALQRQGRDEVVVVSQGDGGCSEGAVYEAWNLAALYKMPIVYVIENNGWAMTVPLAHQTANPNISEKAGACGLPYQIVDGNDILAVRRAMDTAVATARKGQPNVVEMKTLRWEAHFYGQANDYRSDMDLIKDSMENHDCVKNYEAYLLEKGIIDQAYIDKETAQISAEVDEAIEKAAAGDKPSFDDVFKKEYLYATPETGDDL